MKVLTFKRISILSLVLLAASAATAFIAKDKKAANFSNGHLTANANATSTADTCRPPAGATANCNDTQNANGSSSAGGTALTDALATSDGAAGNTSGMD